MKEGKVFLVGAGPGDPALISQKAAECLAKADVVVYDYLVDEWLLCLASRAERIYVGKTGSAHTREQAEINDLLVRHAREGLTVVRLKGGDPFVFGRGGEEADVLQQHGVPFEVVPGISSAVAVPAYAGIPVTHRGVASSFAVITGHEDPAKVGSSIAWEKLATAVDTLIFLMGMQNLPEIVDRLIEYGRRPDTPVAVIKNGTRPEQVTVTGRLDDIVVRVKENRLGPPAVIVVGDVVLLRDKLRWFDNRPLFGKRVLVTRSRHQASALSRLLSERGARPVELPVIEIQPVTDNTEMDRAISELEGYQWLLLTSVNGVDAFFKRLKERGLDARALHGLRVGVIGTATGACLQAKGIVPDYVPEEYTSRGLVAGLGALGIRGKRFLLPRADIADRELVEGITGLGGLVHEIAAYRTAPGMKEAGTAGSLLEAGEIDVITFTSSSTVTGLVDLLDGSVERSRARIACIGPKTAETARRAGLNVDIIAGEQTIPGLVAAMELFFRKGA